MKEIVQSVDRALSILEILSDYSEGLGITSISNKVNIHKSTVHRILATLIYKGYVEQDPNTNNYMITLKLFELGNKKVESMDLLEISKPYTEKLMEKVNEVVHLVVRENNETIYIDKVEADNVIRMASTIGKRNPLYSTSVGKAILAHLPEKEMKKIWDSSKIEKLTEYTIIDFNEMKKELAIVKEKGYSVDNQENEVGVRCIGAPIFNISGEIEGAVSISGPIFRVTEEKIEEFAKEVVECATKISRELGFKDSK
ncbi:MAG TPA: IclR family transcriptional regulator [Thermoanaerobacterales bacterium]|nr:IclR family transcriptional regulator [Thermoanaerobacterales bacterium]